MKIKIKIFLPIIISLFILFWSVVIPVYVPGLAGPVILNAGVVPHTIAYLTLSCSWFFYLTKKNINKTLVISAVLAGTYGILIEIVQSFLPYRYFSVADMGVNFAGALLIFPLFYAFPKKIRNKIKKI
ncbi:MAG: VanZ family protein [Nanoarchaeota archaeon]|nr:VanZ family protein [Nanoarchaeota archaeon]MBU1703798.1 VanZ family protein [Nanoarchaeota archaeon]